MRPVTILLLVLSCNAVFAQTNLKTGVSYGNNAIAGKHIAAKNASLYYEIYGEGEPLLLLHDADQSINAFKNQIKVLSEKYKVIALDSRGRGNSTGLKIYPVAYDLMAEDVKIVLDSLHIPETNILGWGTGGVIGLIMAYRYPTYVHKLAVLSIAAEPLHVKLNNLHSITVPVLVMAGEKDLIHEKQARYLAKEIPNSKLLIFKGALRHAPTELTDDFNSAILRFLIMNEIDIRKVIDFMPEKFN